MPTIDPLGSVAHRVPVDVLRIQADAIGDRPYLIDDENGELSFGQVDELPMTPTNKIQKFILGEQGVGPATWDRTVHAVDWQPTKPTGKRTATA